MPLINDRANSAFGALQSQLESTQAKFNKLLNAKQMLDKIGSAMEVLTSLGDVVTLDDVVKVAGDLVAHGIEPTTMAGILADAPEKGEALAAWLGQQSQQIAQRQAQLQPVLESHQHQLGVQALQTLVAESASEPQLDVANPFAANLPDMSTTQLQ